LRIIGFLPILRSSQSIDCDRYGSPIGPHATINREPGQAWKGAATVVDSCAEVWLIGVPPFSCFISLRK